MISTTKSEISMIYSDIRYALWKAPLFRLNHSAIRFAGFGGGGADNLVTPLLLLTS